MSAKFRNFMNPYGTGNKVASLATIAMLGFFIGIMVQENTFATAPIVMFCIFFALTLRPYFKARKFFASLAGENINAIEHDFNRAYPFVKGRVRMGETYVFSKGSGQLVKYSDMVQVYQYISRTNFIESKRMLRYMDANGRHHELCQLRLRGKSDDELKDMLRVIMRKNPNVKIGT